MTEKEDRQYRGEPAIHRYILSARIDFADYVVNLADNVDEDVAEMTAGKHLSSLRADAWVFQSSDGVDSRDYCTD